MLINDFFKINSLNKEEGSIKTAVTIDRSHTIFKGHFPGQPVVPGVCLTQMVKEVIEEVVNQPLRMSKASNIKFMAVVNPEENADLSMSITYKEIENQAYSVSCETSFKDTVAFKFKGVFNRV